MSLMSPAARRTLLRIHRWTALTFALPLAILIVTGLVLSVEPTLHAQSARAGSIDAGQIAALLARHDPEGRARAITLRPYESTLEIAGVRQGPPLVVDIASGDLGPHGTLARVLIAARHLHVALVGPLKPLVVASTVAFLVLATLGLALGWPRLANSLSGWHRGLAWIGLPLLLLAPVTGLLMVFGVTFGGGGDAPRAMGQQAQPMTLHDTVLAAGASRYLSGMVWMRAMGPRTMLRHTDGTQFQGLFVTADGIVPVPRNIPRAIHEGIWSVRGLLVVNLLISGVSAALWVTGLWLWLRRRNRRRRPLPFAG